MAGPRFAVRGSTGIGHFRHAISQLLEENRYDEALRQVDRAMRVVHPQHRSVIAPIWGELLCAQGDLDGALRAFQQSAEFSPGPAAEASVVNTLVSLDREWAAAERLESALRRYCVLQEGPLARSARRLGTIANRSVPGWAGFDSSLELVGEVLPDAVRGAGQYLEVRGPNGDLLTSHAIGFVGDAPFAFRLALPNLAARQQLQVLLDGMPLLGSGLSYPPDFALDGRASDDKGLVSGWVRLGWLPGAIQELLFEDEQGMALRRRIRRHEVDAGRQVFSLDVVKARMGGRRIRISALLPNGVLELLPDAPLLLNKAIRPMRGKGRSKVKISERSAPRRRPVDVIVPVYLGRQETLACLASVLDELPEWARVVVVDDASPDPLLAAALDEFAVAGRITLLRNASNMGFPAAVNRALALTSARDSVLLNSDTVVFRGWLARLRSAAYSAPNVGTVTPFTNKGTIASYPASGLHDCTDREAKSFDEYAADANCGITVDIPVGVGFCLYLRRDCLQEVGLLDEITFGKGYGEETDFCLRAGRSGWRHVLAANVYVRHAQGASFGTRRAALLERSGRLINLRYPGYDARIAEFIAADPIQPLRRRFDERRLAEKKCRFVVLVTLSLLGGVDRFLAEHCELIRRQGLTPLILMPPQSGKPGLWAWADDRLLGDLHYRVPEDLPGLRTLLLKLDIAHIELHHFLGVDSRVVELVRSIGIAYDAYIHDYTWICPRIRLIDGSNSYCGEPAVAACESCVKHNGSELNEVISVAQLRARSLVWLEGARKVVVPVQDVADRLARYFPSVRVVVKNWETVRGPCAVPTGRPASPVRVALIGAIGLHKGYDVLIRCARDAVKRKLPLEFVVIGYTQSDEPLLRTGKVFITGPYREWEASALLARERTHVAFFPTVWPETWCYSLTHAIRAGLSVLAFNIGAVAERLQIAGIGTLVSIDETPQALNDRLLRMAADKSSIGRMLPRTIKKGQHNLSLSS